jgi:apolipoprotein N-acyltransferase
VIPNFRRRVSRRQAQDYGSAFVQEVSIRDLPEREPRMERLLGVFWVVIVVKCVLVWWVMRHYRMPFSPLWVVVPTVIFAALCTALYCWRD